MTGGHAKFGPYSDEFKGWINNVDLAAMEAFSSLPVAEARIAVAQGEAAVADAFTDIVHEDHAIIAPGVSARVFRQAGTNNVSAPNRPLLMVYHGGGWTVGGHGTEPVLIRTLVKKLGFVAVSIDYRLAPEHPFPTPFFDCYEGLLWAIRNAGKLGIDPETVFVGGSSAGGNLSAAVALRARDEGLTCIKGQILIIPALCHYRHIPKNSKEEFNSYRDLKDVPILSAKSMSAFWDSYYPDAAANATVSPLLAKSHAGLPPAYLQIAGSDVLRDEAIAYVHALMAAGVQVKVNVYPGLPHGFCAPQLGFPSAAKAEEDLSENARWLLGLTTPRSNL